MSKQVKLIFLSIAVLFVIYLVYSTYTASKEGTESFTKFDANSTANKNIKVELVHEKGFIPNPEGGVIFYVKDKSGIEKKVNLGKELPAGAKESKVVTLTGHLHGDYFHATDAVLD